MNTPSLKAHNTSNRYEGLLCLFLIPCTSNSGISWTYVDVLIVFPVLSWILLWWIPISILVTLPVDQSGFLGWFLVKVGVVRWIGDAGAGVVGGELQSIGLPAYGRRIRTFGF